MNVTNQKLVMKYLLFDFFVVFSVAAVVLSTYYGFKTTPENTTSDCDQRSPSYEYETFAEPRFIRETPRPKTPGPGEGEASGPSPVGSVVEVRGIHIAFPAIVTSVEEEYAGSIYNLTNGIANLPLRNIHEQFVHPYRAYNGGTRALCDLQELGEISMVPCTVLSHLDLGESHGGDSIFYEVILTKEQTTFFLPQMRVQRYLQDTRPDTFPVGSVVEIHGHGYAFPATVTDVKEEKKGLLYHLDHGIINTPMILPVESVHPYHVYKGGTMALCNIPKRRGEINMVPCSVISHRGGNDWGDVWYQVTAKLGEGDKRTLTLSRMRVQRFFKNPPEDP